jgi:hypothetical protein
VTDEPVPKYRYGTLWGVLAIFLLIGTVAAAFFVYGLSDLLTTGNAVWDVPILLAGAFVASIMLLLLVGILYRVDRLRGVPHRRMELFD